MHFYLIHEKKVGNTCKMNSLLISYASMYTEAESLSDGPLVLSCVFFPLF